MKKTNAMRILENMKICFDVLEYEYDPEDLSGTHIAESAGIDPETAFKTLVCRSETNANYVFVIPVEYELDLKKCASAAAVKRLELVHVKELLPLTGYIRGGCSPVGMKKQFPTFIDESARIFDKIYVSGGLRGLQIRISPDDLALSVGAVFADLTR